MLEFIEQFPEQMQDAVKRYAQPSLSALSGSISSVVVCGLGGSGIAGDLLSDLTFGVLSVPVVVNKGYGLPAFVQRDALLILCSYSGNTEETISCFHDAVNRGLRPICVASGGQLKQLAQSNGFDFIELPTGFPPRTTLGYGAMILLSILRKAGLLAWDLESKMNGCAEFLLANQHQISQDAKALADKIKFKTVVVTVEDKMQSAAVRLKQQINENSKQNCWYHVVPELNHNELVGWKMRNETLAVVFFRHSFEHKRNKLRFLFIKPVIEEVVSSLTEVQAQGADFFQQCFYFIHFGDWLSYHLAIAHKQDPVEVKVIDKLKAFLNSVPAE
ncbi:MAG: bifunctional phosphoglucose/phosphomannose isomerase [Chitinophagales bacterium]